MPYIKENRRESLEECIKLTSDNLISNINPDNTELTNEELLAIAGDINYTFTRILARAMGNPSYAKIAIITGVLENIKQEFYRRIGVSLEEKKIIENGDIPEYKRRS